MIYLTQEVVVSTCLAEDADCFRVVHLQLEDDIIEVESRRDLKRLADAALEGIRLLDLEESVKKQCLLSDIVNSSTVSSTFTLKEGSEVIYLGYSLEEATLLYNETVSIYLTRLFDEYDKRRESITRVVSEEALAAKIREYHPLLWGEAEIPIQQFVEYNVEVVRLLDIFWEYHEAELEVLDVIWQLEGTVADDVGQNIPDVSIHPVATYLTRVAEYLEITKLPDEDFMNNLEYYRGLRDEIIVTQLKAKELKNEYKRI